MKPWVVKLAYLFGIAVIRLTDLQGFPIWLAVGQITVVRGVAHGESPLANAVVGTSGGKDYFVQEDPARITALIKEADER